MQKSRWELNHSPLSSITLNILKNVGNRLGYHSERHKKLARMGFIYYGKLLPNAHFADRYSYHLTKRGKRVLTKAGITTLEHDSVCTEWFNHMSAPHSDIDALYANYYHHDKAWFMFLDGDRACIVSRGEK